MQAQPSTVRLREASRRDRNAIRDICLSAFPDAENRRVARLAVELLDERAKSASLVLLAESDGEAAGQVAFSPLGAAGADDWLGYLLSPLAVKPAHHGCGIGSALVRTGLKRLSARSVHAVFVYGDPAYYVRFGFRAEVAGVFLPPYELTYPHGWQVTVLHEHPLAGTAARLSCVAPLRDPDLW